jgi:glycosyltransferase involved in cell wall biosynthesis
VSRPTIAVVVPNHNDAAYLPQCLRSLREQDDPPDEVVVVDDASTDDSVAVIESVLGDWSRARVIVNPTNLGTNGALNAGLSRVTSEYVLFLASNDFLLPGIFSRARAALDATPRPAVWSAMAWLVDEHDRVVRLHPSAVVSLHDVRLAPARCAELGWRFGNWFTGTSAIYQRETLLAVGGFDAAYGAPADLITALTVASLKGAAFSPEPLCAIRVHRDSYSSRLLSDPAARERIFERLRIEGPRVAPALFTDRFVDRMALRYRFAAVRAASGDFSGVKPYTTGFLRALIGAAECLPRRWRALRMTLAFALLRPFDIAPTLVNRALPWMVVRLRSQAPARPRI